MDLRLRRRIVAIAAAYAMALQALFAAFLPAGAVNLDADLTAALAVLCAHDGGQDRSQDRSDGGSGTPAHQGLPCAALCAAMGHGLSGPLPPAVAMAAQRPLSLGTIAFVPEWTLPRIALAHSHAPRGPPNA